MYLFINHLVFEMHMYFKFEFVLRVSLCGEYPIV